MMAEGYEQLCSTCQGYLTLSSEWKTERRIYPYKGTCEDCGRRAKKMWFNYYAVQTAKK